jgi:gluconokinase
LRSEAAVVLGIDLGTTATKAVAFDAGGTLWGSASADYPLAEPRPGEAVQDPDEIVRAALSATRAAAGQARGRGAVIAALSFSAAMHSLIALDDRGRPLTPSVTWADGRAGEEAERLRAGEGGLALHRRTGTPLHPMSPLPKLVWFREHQPAVFAAARRWVGIKEYVLAALTGGWAVDHSIASGTGLLDLERLDWDSEALRLAGIDRTQLPDLVPTTHLCDELRPDVAGHLGLDRRTPVVVGAGDGPLANVGVGAVRPGVAACSIGTSGALRVMVERPSVDPRGRVFCYALTPGRWVVGGAINNGGVVLQWAGDALAPDLGAEPEAALVELAARAPAGSGGLIMLPYLLSERAPHWSSLPRGAYVGLTRAHRREHLVRAALEGVCQQLAVVLESMRGAGNEVREVRATGGFARSALWRQILADALGMEIGFPAGHEGSGFGAALLGLQALGRIESLEVAADLVRVEDVTRPDREAAAVYAELLPTFARLYDDLSPAFRALHDFGARPPAPAPPEPAHGRGVPRAS